MGVPPKSDPVWEDIVLGRKCFNLNFLAAKILIGSLMRGLSDNATPENISHAIEEIHSIYEKNADRISVKEDLQVFLGD